MSESIPPIELYSAYRITFSRSQGAGGGGNWYVALREVGLYADVANSGVNLAASATITSSGSYNPSSGPALVVDGNLATYWESNSYVAGNTTAWIQFALPSAVEVRSVRVAGGIPDYPKETPRDFIIQGSNNLTTWTTLSDIKDFGGYKDGATAFLADAKIRLDLMLAGTSRLATGQRSDCVFVHDFSSGELVRKIVPATDGSYQYRPQESKAFLITHLGPAGYAPQADGPVMPAVR